MEFGAFVDLPGGSQALLHISELAHHRVRPFGILTCAMLEPGSVAALLMKGVQCCTRTGL